MNDTTVSQITTPVTRVILIGPKFEVKTSAKKEPVSKALETGTGAAPYMALKSRYGTNFCLIWH